MPRDRDRVLETIEIEMRNNNWDPHIVAIVTRFLELLSTCDTEVFTALRRQVRDYLKDD